MLVQRVLMPVSSLESWTVLGDGGPVVPIERYLAYLTDIERSPNTVKAYAHDLKDWFEFVNVRGLDWREVRLEDLGEFVGWLRLPPAGRSGGALVRRGCATRSGGRRLPERAGGALVTAAKTLSPPGSGATGQAHGGGPPGVPGGHLRPGAGFLGLRLRALPGAGLRPPTAHAEEAATTPHTAPPDAATAD